MPSYAELENWRNRNLKEFRRWRRAIAMLYGSTGAGAVEVQAAVDQTPEMLIDRQTTLAVLFAMNYGEEKVRNIVLAKMVEERLSS